MSRRIDEENLMKWQLKNFHAFLDHKNKHAGEQIEVGTDDLWCPIFMKIDNKDNFKKVESQLATIWR